VYHFNEEILISEIGILPATSCVAFSASAATRQIISYERFVRQHFDVSADNLVTILDRIWVDLHLISIDSEAWSITLSEVMDLIPDEDEEWTVFHALADDAVSSLAYSIRCLMSKDPQEAAWAVRRSYEAVDQAAIRILGVQPGNAVEENQIVSHQMVQRELGRQSDDLILLRNGLIDEVREKALKSYVFFENEVGLLAKS
jgi:uncharacterized protein YjaG (DUF416 family)